MFLKSSPPTRLSGSLPAHMRAPAPCARASTNGFHSSCGKCITSITNRRNFSFLLSRSRLWPPPDRLFQVLFPTKSFMAGAHRSRQFSIFSKRSLFFRRHSFTQSTPQFSFSFLFHGAVRHHRWCIDVIDSWACDLGQTTVAVRVLESFTALVPLKVK